MAISAVAISISISANSGGEISVKFDAPSARHLPPIQTKLTLANLDGFYREFQSYIAKFVDKVIEKSPMNLRSAGHVLEFLHEKGSSLWYDLFSSKMRDDLNDFFKAAVPEWESFGNDNKMPPIIEIVAKHQLLLPLEFIPFFNPGRPLPPTNLDDLRKIACSFPVFSCIVKKVPMGSDPNVEIGSAVLKNIEGLRIRHFNHVGLDGSKIEQQYFQNTSGFSFLGTWPDRELTQDEFEKMFFSLLYKGCDDTSELNPDLDHIQHFTCHCDTEKESSSDYTISLALKSNGMFKTLIKRDITLGNLKSEVMRSSYRRDGKLIYPLIFLNACGSSRFRPGSASSFPDYFIDIRNRGFIGTEANIPDPFAPDFVKAFYNNLLAGNTIGQSMYDCRWNFLLRKNNPLGILYTMYANPDLRVDKPLLRTGNL